MFSMSTMKRTSGGALKFLVAVLLLNVAAASSWKMCCASCTRPIEQEFLGTKSGNRWYHIKCAPSSTIESVRRANECGRQNTSLQAKAGIIEAALKRDSQSRRPSGSTSSQSSKVPVKTYKCKLDGEKRRFEYREGDHTLYAYKTKSGYGKALGEPMETIKLNDVDRDGLKKVNRKHFTLTMKDGTTHSLGSCLPTGDPTDLAKFLRDGKLKPDQVDESFKIKRKGSKRKSGASQKRVSIEATSVGVPGPTELLTPLPAGWKEKKDETGKVYYQNASANRTQWHHPNKRVPVGWNEETDKNGAVYFCHASDGSQGQWEFPTGPAVRRRRLLQQSRARRRRLLERLQGSRARRQKLLERVHGSRASKRRLLERLQGF